MTHISNATSLQVFKISELSRLVTIALTRISLRGVVSITCACQCLEEPALGVLWARQPLLCTLLEVLPGAMLEHNDPECGEHQVRCTSVHLGVSDASVYAAFSSRS